MEIAIGVAVFIAAFVVIAWLMNQWDSWRERARIRRYWVKAEKQGQIVRQFMLTLGAILRERPRDGTETFGQLFARYYGKSMYEALPYEISIVLRELRYPTLEEWRDKKVAVG